MRISQRRSRLHVFSLRRPAVLGSDCAPCRRYDRWLLQGLGPAEAYSERAGAHTAGRAFLQARADAAAALAALSQDGTPQVRSADPNTYCVRTLIHFGVACCGSE